MYGRAPCPLGMTLIIKSVSLVPSCVGTQIDALEALGAGSIGGVLGAAGTAAVSAVGKAAVGAVGAAAVGAIAGSGGSGSSSAAEAAAVRQSQEWGGATNFGGVTGFGGVTTKVISCDEYASMTPGMVNPQNASLSYEDRQNYGEGEVQNGWWAQKLTYNQWPSGVAASGYGGAVVQYASLSQAGGAINQKATVISVGSCERKVYSSQGAQDSCVSSSGAFVSASCALSLAVQR